MRRLSLVLSLVLTTTSILAADDVRDPLRGRDLERGRHMILNPRAPLTAEDRAELSAKGVEVQNPLSGGRYLARVTDVTRVAGDARVLSLEPMTAEHKILRSAFRAASRSTLWVDVTVIFQKDVSFEEARQSIMSAGGALEDAFDTDFGPSKRVEARLTHTALTTLGADDRVLAVGGRSPLRAIEQNARSAALSHVPEVYAAPYNLSGAGQVVMVSELSLAQVAHPEFEGRVTAGVTGSNGSHATHVSGTIGAAGIRADAKGMAPKVHIDEFNVGGSASSHLKILKTQLPLLHPISNNTSLGFPLGWCNSCGSDKWVWNDEEEYYGAYEAGYGTPAYDDITAQYGTLLIFSAGNDGDYPFLDAAGTHLHVNPDTGDPDESKLFCFSFNGSGTDCQTAGCNGGCEVTKHHLITPFDTMTVTGAAKNVIAVGAMQTATATPGIADFSSRGPAKDGRVKPDLVARGQSVLSTTTYTAPQAPAYASMSGTSMSSPVVTGISALIAEQWKNTFGSQPTPAELRAVLLAGAQDLGNPGPDYTFGFGLVDAKASADLIRGDGGTHTQITNVSLLNGGRSETTITLSAAQNLRVLVAWPDPSVILLGNDSISAKALVNDLDIQVIGPGGNTVLPYVLDKVNYNANATRGVNTTDNTELVEIPNAAPGVYKLIVTGTKVSVPPQTAVIVANAKGSTVTQVPCSDPQEPNNTPEQAYGNVPPNQSVSGAICTEGDLDYIKFVASRFGPISATITSAATPLRLTLSAANGQTATVDVPANSTRTATFQYGSGTGQAPELRVTAKVEATSAIDGDSRYSLFLVFGQFAGERRRAIR